METETNYYREIENYLVSKRGRGLLISTSDYKVMKKWEKDGIPLEVIKKGIELTIDGINFSKRNKVNGIVTLSSCNRKVQKLWREQCDAKKGSQDEWMQPESDALKRSLAEDVASMLREIEKNKSSEWVSPRIREAVEGFCGKLQELIGTKRGKSVEDDEERYEELEELREESFEKIISLLSKEEKKSFLVRWEKNLKRIKQTAGKNEFEKTCKELLKISIAEKLGV